MNKKKVLIITYYWPPAGGPGVQRWLKFVKYLPEFNIEPVVYIPENANYPLEDKSLISEVSDSLVVLKHPIKEPYKLARLLSKKSSKTISKGIIPNNKEQSIVEKLMLFVRGNYFIPDARKSWVKPSISFLSEYISKENIDTIITSGPPHSLHLIGLQLKAELNIKWISDFRDPWTTIGYHKQLKLTKKSEQKHKALEKQVLNTADQIIVTSTVTKREFQNLTSKSIEVITNGYDREEVGKITLDSKFSIAHIGSLLSERNPKILWKVLGELIKENESFSNNFVLKFVGAVSEDLLKELKRYGVENHYENVGYVSHKEAIEFQRQSQVLLLIEINSEDTKCIIPGKLFEYMASNRPILSLGPKGSDVERIIKETNTGDYFYYDEYNLLKSTILNHYESYLNNTLQSQAIGLQKYSRKKLTEQLVNIIKE